MGDGPTIKLNLTGTGVTGTGIEGQSVFGGPPYGALQGGASVGNPFPLPDLGKFELKTGWEVGVNLTWEAGGGPPVRVDGNKVPLLSSLLTKAFKPLYFEDSNVEVIPALKLTAGLGVKETELGDFKLGLQFRSGSLFEPDPDNIVSSLAVNPDVKLPTGSVYPGLGDAGKSLINPLSKKAQLPGAIMLGGVVSLAYQKDLLSLQLDGGWVPEMIPGNLPQQAVALSASYGDNDFKLIAGGTLTWRQQRLADDFDRSIVEEGDATRQLLSGAVVIQNFALSIAWARSEQQKDLIGPDGLTPVGTLYVTEDVKLVAAKLTFADFITLLGSLGVYEKKEADETNRVSRTSEPYGLPETLVLTVGAMGTIAEWLKVRLDVIDRTGPDPDLSEEMPQHDIAVLLSCSGKWTFE